MIFNQVFNQVFRRKNLVIRLMNVGGRAGGRKQFLLCATPPTFFKGFWRNFHKSFVIKFPGAYRRCFAIQTFLAELWPFDFSKYSEIHFCAQLLLHLWMDFDQTFTKALSSSALAHIVGVFRFKYFWQNYGPLFFTNIVKYTSVCNSYSSYGIWWNFHISFVIKCPGLFSLCFGIQAFLAELRPFVF